MTEREDVYRALNAHSHEVPEEGWIDEGQVEIAVQLRRAADHLEALSESRVSVAVSLDRIAAALERAFPPVPKPSSG